MPKGKPFNVFKPRRGIPHGMFSTLEDLIEAAPQERMTAQQWKEYLAPGRILEREGVKFPLKKEELEYTGALEWLDDLIQENPTAPVHREYLLGGIQEQRPRFERDVAGKNVSFDQYSTQGPRRLGYFESITDSPDFGKFSTHFGDETLSWHRGSRHALGPDPRTTPSEPGTSGVLRLIDEIQSDRHSAAAEKVPNPEFDRLTREAGDNLFRDNESAEVAVNQTRGMSPTIRRGYRTPEEQEFHEKAMSWEKTQEREFGSEDDAEWYTQFNDIRRKPPDAPFKSPADYGRLELKRGILDAIREGDQFLGVTPSEGPIGWFNLGRDAGVPGEFTTKEAAGASYVYDNIYPGELRKLAQQYSAPMRELDVPVVNRNGQLDVIAESESNDLPDYLIMAGELDLEGYQHSLENLIDGYRRALPPDPVVNRMINNAHEELETIVLSVEDGENLQQDRLESMLYQLDDLYRKTRPESDATRKVPAMELTPEVIERIKKAGIPLWAITGGIVGADALMEQDRAPEFAKGGKVAKIFHVGRDFEAFDPKFIGTGEGRMPGGPLNPLGPGLYGGTGKREKDARELAKLYGKYVENPFLHVFETDLVPGRTLWSSNDSFTGHLAEGLSEVQEKLAELYKKYRTRDPWVLQRKLGHQEANKALRELGLDSRVSAELPFGAHEIAVYEPSVLRRIGKEKFSRGGPVDDGYDPESYPELTEHQDAVEEFLRPSLMRRIANFGPDGPGKNRRKNFMTGILTQTMGLDTEGEPSFLGMDRRRNPDFIRQFEMLGPAGGILSSLASMRPGLVEEVIAMPNYFNFVPGISRLDNPRSAEAAENQEHLEAMLRGEMDAPDPEGFGDTAAYNAGIMMGQLPIPGKSAASAVKGGMGMLEKVGKAGVEFFSPVIKPSPANYAAGTAFGTALSELPEGISRIQQARQALDPLGLNPVTQIIRMIQDKEDVDPPEFASGGFVDVNIPGSSPKTPANQQPTYQAPQDPYQGLLNYGAGPERDFFPGRTFTPLDVDFSDWSVDAPKSSGPGNTSKVAGVLGSLPAVWKGLGYADKILGTGMQEGIKGWGKGMLSKLGIGGGSAASGSLASLGGVSMGGAPVTTALPASLGGSGSAAAGTSGAAGSGALAALAPLAPVAIYALQGGFDKDPARAGGTYDADSRQLNFSVGEDARGARSIMDAYGLTDADIWGQLEPMITGAYGTDNWTDDYFKSLVERPENYTSDVSRLFSGFKDRTPQGLTRDQAMQWVLYDLMSGKLADNSLWTGKGDIMHAYEEYMNAQQE